MSPAVWFAMAAGAYVVNAAFGGAVRLRMFSSAGFRWAHHALYILTFVLTAAAISTLWWSESPAGWYLLPAVVPLVVLPYAGSARKHGGRHIAIASAAAPFYLLSLIVVLTVE